MSTLALSDLLDVLGYEGPDRLQLCTQTAADQPFIAKVLQNTPETLPQDRNVWFGVNPIADYPVGRMRRDNDEIEATLWEHAQGRPASGDVTRFAALYADLDVKDRGCPSFEVAHAIIDQLSAHLGTRPSAITYSGHGLQPLWPIEDGQISTDEERSDMRAVNRRWGRLVAHVAELLGAEVDGVYDLARVLRAPGSQNVKGSPIPVVTLADTGAPVSVERVLETLDELNVPDLADDHADPGAVVSAPADWHWAEKSECGYASKMAAGWAKDDPADRHPWLVAQATRIAVLHRNGCLTVDDYAKLKNALLSRFQQLINRGGTERKPGPGEIYDAFAWGQIRAAAKSDTAMVSEMGGHLHATASVSTPPIKLPPMDELTERRLQKTLTDGSSALAAEPAVSTVLLSEDGNAEMLIRTHGEILRYCHERGRWLYWSGHHWVWQPSGGGYARELAKDVARRLPEATDWKKRSLSAVGISNCLTQASTDARITVDLADLDADPWALNTPDGIVDMRTGLLYPPDPAALCTRVATVSPDDQGMAAWLQFLRVTFGDDQELMGYLQRLVGYSATGHIGPHVLPFAHGSGGNGKGVFLEAIGKVLGDYATTAPNAFLMARQYGQHETEIARLAGARMVLCSEVNETDRFDEAKVKQLTGGDTLTARFMRQDHFTFEPTHHLWLMGNHKPAVTSGGRSFWRRCRLIPFMHEVPDSERVDDLQGILASTAGPAIMAWIVQGAAEYHKGGLREPESVIKATEEYAHDQDTVARFVDEMCHLAGSPVLKVACRDLYTAYEQWCSDVGEAPVSAKRLGTDLRARFNVGDSRDRDRRFYTGIGLQREVSDV